METYVLKYPDGTYVALDPTSGGYPYPTKDWRSAKLWNDIDDANKYRNHDFGAMSVVKLLVSERVIAEAGEEV